jgi:hypothetical protein
MDGTARVPEGRPRVERSFEWSRLSSQLVSLAYEQAVAIGRGGLSPRSQDHHGPGRCESSGTNDERRWVAGG